MDNIETDFELVYRERSCATVFREEPFETDQRLAETTRSNERKRFVSDFWQRYLNKSLATILSFTRCCVGYGDMRARVDTRRHWGATGEGKSICVLEERRSEKGRECIGGGVRSSNERARVERSARVSPSRPFYVQLARDSRSSSILARLVC